MVKKKYLLRLDDACPTMHAENWKRIEEILDRFGVKPMVGVIPCNNDPKQIISDPNPSFWKLVKSWENKGWAIALHGYDHCYITNDAGINPLWNRSEFAGVSLEEQKQKIRKGVEIFRENDIEPKYFFAPSHTFDLNTLEALRECSNIRIVSDTIANKPYRYKDFIFIPQLGGHCIEMKLNGIWTFCLHPSAMKDSDFKTLEDFLNTNEDQFISFKDVDLNSVGSKNAISRVLSFMYFSYRKLIGLK